MAAAPNAGGGQAMSRPGICGNGAPPCRVMPAAGRNPLRLCAECLWRYRSTAREASAETGAKYNLGAWELSPIGQTWRYDVTGSI